MKILIDIGHPGHVHYFKHLINNLKANKNKVLVIARDKEVTFNLLYKFKISFISRKKGRKSLLGKLLYLIYASFLIYLKGLKFKPDIIMGFASPYASLASFFLKRVNITLDDTEVGSFEQLFYKPLSNLILTPKAFQKNLGNNHFRFNGFMELSYLLPKYFRPDPKIKDILGITNKEKYTIIRFVSWEASHDKGQSGLTVEQKYEIINLCLKYGKVFISSEKKLPVTFERYKLKISPDQLHNVLYYAQLYIGEGATTASESSILGTPAIYINTITAGTIEEQEKYGLLFNHSNYSGVKEHIKQVLKENKKNYYVSLSKRLIAEKIDVTAFMTWFIENYPKSVNIMKENPDYQWKFK